MTHQQDFRSVQFRKLHTTEANFSHACDILHNTEFILGTRTKKKSS